MLFNSLSDYHLHTPLCAHASGWPVEFAERALQLGFKEIGFADHNPMPEYFDDWRMSLAELPRYLDAVAEARARFPELVIRLGLECDYLPGREAWIEELATLAEWDFLIGSVHYLPEGWEVDHPKYIGRHAGASEPIWESYWTTYTECIRSGLFDFVAHPDLPKKFNYRPEGDLRRFYEPAIEALRDTGIAFEINTAGLRKECRELYPEASFVRMAHAAGIPLLINSDAHAVDELGAGFDQAAALAIAAGYTETVR
ncbi:MAG: histidinol-phosphatase, partial [Verrucomicrobiota bacterium]